MTISFDPDRIELPLGHWIGDRLVSGAPEIELLRPSDAVSYARCPVASADIVDQAVSTAKSALRSSGWATWRPRLRAEALHRWADLIIAEGEKLGRLESLSSARPIAQSVSIDVAVTAEQIRFFADLPAKTEADFLSATLDDVDEGVGKIAAMVAAWAAGDTAELEKEFISEMKGDYPELYDLLIVRRNADWARQLKTKLAGSGTSFVAVGSGHLVGPDSVQAELAKLGIKAERLE